MDFKIKLKEYQDIVNKELEKYIVEDRCYEKRLNEAARYSLLAGGKRLRPILVLDVYKLFKDDYEKCFPYAVALEMIHNFSLIHDDLPEIDNDDFRHGIPTNHKKFGHGTALLAGDKLFNEAYIVLSDDLKNENNSNELSNKLKVFNEFSKAVERMISGEYLDTELENTKIEKDVLKYIHENKTGALLKLSVRMGAILAGADESDIERLSVFAEKIGLAFQIKDDILSEEGNEEEMGKPVGNDKALNKSTYVSFYGLEGAKEELNTIINEALEILNFYNEKAEFLKELTLYIRDRRK